jgi:bifunctional non-homologous end joining protein LigD
MGRPLSTYRAKRDFAATAEPRGADTAGRKAKARTLAFVIQKHAASHLHFDLRLELDGVMKSWAVPKGPSFDPDVKRLAMEVEDHPIEYNSFEGTIPKGQYGGGTVMLWDRGTYTPDEATPGEDVQKAVRRGLRSGKLSLTFHGERLRGSFALVRTAREGRPQWLFFKHRDDDALPGSDIVADVQTSVESGRTMEEIASSDGAVWQSNRMGDDLAAVLDAFEQDALEPMIATRNDVLGEGIWAVEPECDGQRVLAFAGNGTARIITLARGGSHGRAAGAGSLEAVERALEGLARRHDGPLVLDGFLVTDPPARDALALVAVDVLVDGTDLLIEEPYLERRDRLERALEALPARGGRMVRAVPAVFASADELPAAMQSLGADAVVAKRVDTPYESGVSKHWLVITECDAARGPRRSGAVGQHHPPAIPADAQDLVFTDGDREVRLTNLQKVFWPEEGITKGDLLRYYAAVAPYLLPHLVDRAMVMKRYPHGASGEFFFMKRAPSPRPDWIETCAITHASKSVIDFPMVQDLASLLWVVNLGCIDLNPWYSRCDDVDRPDYLHFDLDPVPEAGFDRVRETAMHLRDLLQEFALPAFPKTSGSKGIHVYVPIVRGPLQKQVWTIAKAIAKEMESRHPRLVTAEYRIAKRPKGRVLVDYNQNAWGRTLASIYSVRPRPSASVSMPVTWEEVEAGVRIEDFTLRGAPDRLRETGDLWAPLLDTRDRADLAVLL